MECIFYFFASIIYHSSKVTHYHCMKIGVSKRVTSAKMNIGFICILWLVACISGEYVYVTKYIDVPVDHFSFARNDSFKLKYLINDTFWKNSGPVFFYTGNEGAIELFAKNSGFIWETAPIFNALVVFAEHRYYGTSMPFGNESFSNPARLGYLSSTQALADYVYLIADIQKGLMTNNRGSPSPVIAFGGSYGGMLAAWIRLKYPGSVHASVASSAPIFQFSGLTKCGKFYEILASVFKASYNTNCVQNIKQSWKQIRDISSTSDGKTWLTNTLKLCKPLTSSDDVYRLIYWLKDVYSNLAMANYPYPNNFLATLPAYPVREFCSRLGKAETGKPLLQSLSDALSIYTNYTGENKCVNTNSSTANIDETAWYFQACTEMIMPMCTDDNDMFEASPWDFKAFADGCFTKFGVRTTRDDVAILEYGGKRALYTNIVFTNGLLDPWSGGGYLVSSTSAYAILIPNAAHHLELRASNPADPQSVVTARVQIRNLIGLWIKAFK